jgi:hypothetical protein
MSGSFVPDDDTDGGRARLIDQLEAMLTESGDPAAAAGFDVSQWLTNWLEQPVAALGGRCPAEYMHSIEGREKVARLLAMMQSGAFA